MKPSRLHYCQWCGAARAQWYTHVGHILVCSTSCPKRPFIRSGLIRIVGTDYGDTTLCLSPEEYETRLVANTDAIIREYHPHLLRETAPPPAPEVTYTAAAPARAKDHAHDHRHHGGGQTSYGPRGARPGNTSEPFAPLPVLADGPKIKGITRSEDMCDGRARIAGTNVPVWMIVDATTRGATVEEIERHWMLTDDQVEAALAYWDAYQEEIQHDLHEEVPHG